MKQLNKLALVTLTAFTLAGCRRISEQYQSFIEEKAEVTTTQATTSNAAESTAAPEKTVDSRFVPEQAEVEEAIKGIQSLKVNNELYRLKQPIVHSQAGFDLVVKQMVIYEAASNDAVTGLSNDGGAIVLINAAITNTTKAPFYFPIDELRLTYVDAPVSHYSSQGLYPMESGNLQKILLENGKGEMAAGSTVEGYLVFALSKEDLEKAKDLGALYLTVVPPVASNDAIVGLETNDLGSELPLFLPLSEQVESELHENASRIQDRVTAEWWGTKNVLADETLDMTAKDKGVTFNVKRIEVSDFTPKEHYKESFQYFPNGQVIVSVEVEVENNTDEVLLPVDSKVTLTINNNVINSDYVLINQLYGQRLEPGQSTTIIKSFALDKKTYQEQWQDKEMVLNMVMSPVKAENKDKPIANEQTTNMEQVEEFISEEATTTTEADEQMDESTVYSATFQWMPVLKQYINGDLKVVSSLDKPSETSETTVEESTVEETTEAP
ncbi:hypothetical protein I4Q36_06710 [Tuanshanicoccus lijuaniae]|uniref:hypothetical protein n=1 Tax=Aerococcaceae bacterium zg-1292 TaxID=2774330 RepID=UPI00193601FC|nr:hypothetical protein [Aerococcaceae bacterium zg-1292]MBF6977630.1 hypothetical protein [Aerococcaceae bacterium zg-BR22]MBS4457028.1 hypothetical protein [Aerococcaceae bacterium zg-A91]MBS4458869.1 hypothetical protein [Aerococcaceae bacterium zg-BR33]QQA36503.1 hypothetical protein I4Q36_06710 [Aerococcaceae bacterium zg-1292]